MPRLTALADKGKIATAYARMAEQLGAGGEPRECWIGYQGGSERATVLWHASRRFWVLLEPERLENRYWCAYGLEEPHSNSLLSITGEINIPRAGINRRVAGAFAEDRTDGTNYLVHSGKVGGGRKGIGKQAFLDFYKGQTCQCRWPDGEQAECIPIGPWTAACSTRLPPSSAS